MPGASDWYARHLGNGHPPAPQLPPPPPPGYALVPQAPPAPPPLPQGYQPPPGYVLVPAQQQYPQPPSAYVQPFQQTYGQPGYPQQFQQPQQQMPWEQFNGRRDPWAPPPPGVDTSTIPKGYVTPENFLDMAKFWRGGRGNKEAQHCPRCDGVMYRRFQGQKEAAPMCTECGWNGLFDQGEWGHAEAS